MNRRAFLIAAATSLTGLTASAAPDVLQWNGTALGADSRILIAGLSQSEASRAIAEVRNEVERLEQAFSLYRSDSELSRLNRDGFLPAPSQDFRILLETALNACQASEGCFNPAIQPLWLFLARHFASPGATNPSLTKLKRMAAACHPSRIECSSSRVTVAPGMALTFNGIAQGYITDSAASLLQARGLRNILIDLGEFRALAGKAWDVEIPALKTALRLEKSALAVSTGSGTPFTADGKWHHILDPFTGQSARCFVAVAVTAPSAAVADMLSTALYVAPTERHAAILRRYPGATVKVLTG